LSGSGDYPRRVGDRRTKSDGYTVGCILTSMHVDLRMLRTFPPSCGSLGMNSPFPLFPSPARRRLTPRDTPAAFGQLVDQLLEKSPAKRPQTVVDVRRILEDMRDAGQLSTSAARSHARLTDTRPSNPDASQSDPFAETAAAPSTPSNLARTVASVATSRQVASVATSSPEPVVASLAPAPAPRRLGLYAVLGGCVFVAVLAAVLMVGRSKPPAQSQQTAPPAVTPDTAGIDGAAEVATPAAVVDAAVEADAAVGTISIDAGTKTKKRDPRPSRRDAGTSSDMPDIDFVPARKSGN